MDAPNTHSQTTSNADFLARYSDAFDIEREQRLVARALGLATKPALDVSRRHEGALALKLIELTKRGALGFPQRVGGILHEEEQGGDGRRARAQPTAASRDRRGSEDDGRRAERKPGAPERSQQEATYKCYARKKRRASHESPRRFPFRTSAVCGFFG